LRLETERLFLREWSKKDAADLIEGLNNLNVSIWLAVVPHPYTKEDADKWINYCIQNARVLRERNSYEFAIELKSEKKVIGGLTLERISYSQGTAGGGIWINEKYQNYGYGTESFGERIRFAFMDLNLRRLENGYVVGNNSSSKMQKKFGYEVEGIRRKSFRCMADEKVKDEYITVLTRKRWVEIRGQAGS